MLCKLLSLRISKSGDKHAENTAGAQSDTPPVKTHGSLAAR